MRMALKVFQSVPNLDMTLTSGTLRIIGLTGNGAADVIFQRDVFMRCEGVGDVGF